MYGQKCKNLQKNPSRYVDNLREKVIIKVEILEIKDFKKLED